MSAVELVMMRANVGQEEAEAIIRMAEALAMEQGDAEFDPSDWLSNRTYEWSELLDAARGDVSAIARVRAEAGLPALC